MTGPVPAPEWPAPPVTWGGRGPLLHLAHANGFPPAVYGPLAERLTTAARVLALPLRPLWPGADPRDLDDWTLLADDLERGLAGVGPVVGLGHSVGAVATALLAVRRPELFSALVLVDPVLFTGGRSVVWGIARRLGLTPRMWPASAARRRREVWPSREAARRSWSGKPLFARWDAAAFAAYLETGLTDAGDGALRLTYPAAWEARVFATAPASAWAAIGRLQPPVLLIRGERSETFTAAAARRFARELPAARTVTLPDAGHLVPMERPDRVADAVLDLLRGTA